MPRSAWSYAPELAVGPGAPLAADECGLLAQEPAQGSTSNASGVRTGPTVNKGALSGPEGANSSAPLTAGEGPAPQPTPQPPSRGLPKRDAGRAGARLAPYAPGKARERAALLLRDEARAAVSLAGGVLHRRSRRARRLTGPAGARGTRPVGPSRKPPRWCASFRPGPELVRHGGILCRSQREATGQARATLSVQADLRSE